MAQEHLRRMLKDEPDIDIVGVAASGHEAVEAIEQCSPDLVFLDVQLPDLDGFEVLARVRAMSMPVVIFVTANDEFAVRAFEVHALDYLVKPATPERFQSALQRARAQIERNQTGDVQRRLTALLRDLQAQPRQTERLAVKTAGRIVVLRLAEIDWVEAADNYVKLHAGNESHLLRETMTSIESRLPGHRFVRISRSTIVNVERVKELHPMFHGEYVVVLRNAARLTLTRGYRDNLERLALA